MEEIVTPTVNISGAGEYQISIEKHSCKASSNVFQIELLQDSLFVPNVVTANADQYNDQFEIYIENANYKDVSIYNRKGRIVFEDGDYQQSWPDGEYPTGVYYYICNYSTVCNPKVSTMKGWLQLLK